MVKLTSDIPISASGTNTSPIYGPKYEGDYGSLARVDKLSKGHQKGSEAQRIFIPNYRILNIRKQGGRSFYVRGHLLSWHVGGPGNDWRNLTPLFQDANQDHEKQFEGDIKSAVKSDKQVQKFKVQAIYGRSKSGHIDTLRNPNDDTIPSGMNPNYDPFDVADLLEAETKVPNRLECSAEIIEKDGKVTPINKPIKNPINYGNLSSYDLEGKPKKEFNLTEKVNNANSKDGAINNLMVLSGVGKERAEKMYNRIKIENKKITDYYAQINISKKNIEKLNPGVRIVQR